MKLYIDTRDRNKISVSILKNKEVLILKETNSEVTPESALSLLEKALKEKNFSIEEIEEIEVERGPGSYTGTRVGVAVANALSFSLQIPVNSNRLSSLEVPEY